MNKVMQLPFAHTHHYKMTTSEKEEHEHSMVGFSFPANGCDRDEHIHRLEGVTLINDHQHRYSLKTGPPIPLSGGGHYHEFDGETFSHTKHEHSFYGRTSLPLGYYPTNW